MSPYAAVALAHHTHIVACLECGALVVDQESHDVHHASDATADRLRQLELERTMPSRLA